MRDDTVPSPEFLILLQRLGVSLCTTNAKGSTVKNVEHLQKAVCVVLKMLCEDLEDEGFVGWSEFKIVAILSPKE